MGKVDMVTNSALITAAAAGTYNIADVENVVEAQDFESCDVTESILESQLKMDMIEVGNLDTGTKVFINKELNSTNVEILATLNKTLELYKQIYGLPIEENIPIVINDKAQTFKVSMSDECYEITEYGVLTPTAISLPLEYLDMIQNNLKLLESSTQIDAKNQSAYKKLLGGLTGVFEELHHAHQRTYMFNRDDNFFDKFGQTDLNAFDSMVRESLAQIANHYSLKVLEEKYGVNGLSMLPFGQQAQSLFGVTSASYYIQDGLINTDMYGGYDPYAMGQLMALYLQETGNFDMKQILKFENDYIVWWNSAEMSEFEGAIKSQSFYDMFLTRYFGDEFTMKNFESTLVNRIFSDRFSGNWYGSIFKNLREVEKSRQLTNSPQFRFQFIQSAQNFPSHLYWMPSFLTEDHKITDDVVYNFEYTMADPSLAFDYPGGARFDSAAKYGLVLVELNDSINIIDNFIDEQGVWRMTFTREGSTQPKVSHGYNIELNGKTYILDTVDMFEYSLSEDSIREYGDNVILIPPAQAMQIAGIEPQIAATPLPTPLPQTTITPTPEITQVPQEPILSTVPPTTTSSPERLAVMDIKRFNFSELEFKHLLNTGNYPGGWVGIPIADSMEVEDTVYSDGQTSGEKLTVRQGIDVYGMSVSIGDQDIFLTRRSIVESGTDIGSYYLFPNTQSLGLRYYNQSLAISAPLELINVNSEIQDFLNEKQLSGNRITYKIIEGISKTTEFNGNYDMYDTEGKLVYSVAMVDYFGGKTDFEVHFINLSTGDNIAVVTHTEKVLQIDSLINRTQRNK